jgi:NAD+ synthetase
MRLALARFNPTVGDVRNNARAMATLAQEAATQGADLVVFPELALTGYPPKDLLLVQGFVEAAEAAALELARAAPPRLTLVIGGPRRVGNGSRAVANGLFAFQGGEPLATYDKRLLPTYDVFDEDRYFTPGNAPVILTVAGLRVGLSICEDLWRGQDVGFADRYLASVDPLDELCTPRTGEPGAELIVNPSASPFVLGKGQRHRDLLQAHARSRNVAVAAVNQLGGNDELIFDGASWVFAKGGKLIAEGERFTPGLTLADLPSTTTASPAPPTPPEHDLFRALTLGIRDYARKTGFKSAVLGLSGGIDSAVCAVLAAAAIGPAAVLGLSMPSRYSSQGSRDDAADLANRLGTRYETIAIEPAFNTLRDALGPLFTGRPEDVTEENLQSRIRGTLLMAASNKFGHLLLTTGNKSELAVGYCTLYGDMNGGLAVLSDVTKVTVYRLARWINAHPAALGIPGLTRPPIPEPSITKPPSAELRPNQTDQDSLPPYEILDEIIERSVEARQSPATIATEMARSLPAGNDPAALLALVRKVTRMIDLAEYKRKQAPIGLKVTSVAFGSGRRMPIAQAWRGDAPPAP